MQVLLVSKPVAPPWNDSSKNLVRDLATHLRRHRPVVLSQPGATLSLPSGSVEAVYPARRGRFSPALVDNARVMARLLTGRRCDLWHFFFAPNLRSSRMALLASRARRVPTVQTVCSAPAQGVDLRAALFADRVVVLSEHTEARLRAEGVEDRRLVRIPPAVPLLATPSESARQALRAQLSLREGEPVLLYPGDLEFSRGADLSLETVAALRELQVQLVLACRAKTPAAQAREQALRARAQALDCAQRVRFVGEVSNIHTLLSLADLVLLPSETLYAKMDLPLVLLEAMALQRPVLCATGTPAQELAATGAAVAVAPHRSAVVDATAALLRDAPRRLELGRRAREAVRTDYSPQRMAERHEALYDELA